MTITKGGPWGLEGVVPAGTPTVSSDRELAESLVPCVLAGGNIHSALGRPVGKTPGEKCMVLPIDGLVVNISFTDGSVQEMMAAGEVVIGRWLRDRHCVIVTNAGLLGDLNIAPRAHPNDGVFDVFTRGEGMSFRERVMARRRARTGIHVPHPHLESRQLTTWEHERHSGEPMWVDGRRIQGWSHVSIRISADRWSVVV